MNYPEALEKLKQGNQRFATGLKSVESLATEGRRLELAQMGQQPFAIILSCADSRVPSEMVFDSGLGELFVVRVAGNIVAPSLIGSIEFAAEKFGTQLCVVMGHSQCGAVTAALDVASSGNRPQSDNVQNIVLEIMPSVEQALAATVDPTRDAVVDAATALNVRHSVDQLQERSGILTRLVAAGRLLIVGATYNLHTGKVSFLEGEGPLPSRASKRPGHYNFAPRDAER